MPRNDSDVFSFVLHLDQVLSALDQWRESTLLRLGLERPSGENLDLPSGYFTDRIFRETFGIC